MQRNWLPNSRYHYILEQLKKEKTVHLEKLAKTFDVTPMTVRRDLLALEKKGLLERVHGGASVLHPIESFYSEKDKIFQEDKKAIAELAATKISANDTIFINSGSTTFQLIQALAYRDDIHIITNNQRAMAALPEDATVPVILIGGNLRKKTRCTVGETALEQIARISCNKAFIGTDGITLENGLTSPNLQEASVAKAMIAHTYSEVFILAHHTKVGIITTHFIADISEINYLVTTKGSESRLFQELDEQLEILLVE